MKEKSRKGVSRRQFLAGSALAAGSLVALGGCAPTGNGAGGTQADSATAAADSSGDASTGVRRHAAELNPQQVVSAGTSSFPTLFSGWNFGTLALENRVVKSAAGVPGIWAGGVADEPINYFANLVKGGAKLVYTDDFAEVYPHFRAIPEVGKLENVPEADFKKLVDAVHAEGGYIGYQLATMGLLFSGFVPTDAMFQSSGCKDMTHDEIKQLQEDTFVAAKMLKDVGFDALEINAAGENVGQTFLSRNRNTRDDEYGAQNMENRTRFLVELIEGIKNVCGSDYPLQVLINGIEENDGVIGENSRYTTVEENKEICKILEAAGADSLHIRIGPSAQHVCEFAGDLYFTGYGIEGTTSFGTQFDFERHWEGKLVADRSGAGVMVEVAAELKKEVSIPVGVVTYMDPAHDPEYFEGVLADGKVDFMLINRPLNVDNDYLNKLQEGRLDEIAPCTRCLHCHWDFNRAGEMAMSCRVNAAAYRAYREPMPEGFAPTPASTAKKVMVIGAGPAGMEAARVAAERGHTVTIYEKKSSVGGLLDFAHAVKGDHENLDDLRNYLARQLEVKGVEVVTGKEVDEAFINEQAPDAIILAAGGLRDSLGLTETSGTKIIPIEDFLTADIGEDVTIAGSNAQAVDTALYLLAQGKNVSFVTPSPLEALGDGQSFWVKSFVNPMIKALGSRIWPNAEIKTVGDGEVTIVSEAGVEVTFPCATVIEAMDMLPNTSLVDGVTIEAYAVGDCKEPYNIANAIATGNLAARHV